MEPVTAGILGASILSGGLQYMNSSEAQDLSAKERANLQAMLNAVKNPNFDIRQITPEQYQVLQKFNPTIASYVQEKNPELLKANSQGAVAGRDAEMSALEQMLNKSRGGQDILSDIARNKASRQTANDASSQRASLDQLFQRRGVAPGGMMQYGAQLGGISDAANREALANEAGAESEIGRRDTAMMNAGNLGSKIRGEDVDLEKTNVGAINDFNQRMAHGQNAYNQYSANEQNKGNLYNIGAAQDVANQNTGLRNDYQKYNQSYGNQMKQQDFTNQLNKLGQQSNVTNMAQQGIMGGAQQQNQAIQGISNAGISGLLYGAKTAQNDQDNLLKKQELQAKYPNGTFG